jgi:hypothetical protein
VESVTTLALIPSDEELIAFARSESELTPLPVVNVACEPLPSVIVRVDVPRLAVELGSAPEYQDAFVARLDTLTECVPMVAPAVAEPVTCVELDESARVVSEPSILLRSSRSCDTADRALCIEVNAVICDEIVDCSVCH